MKRKKEHSPGSTSHSGKTHAKHREHSVSNGGCGGKSKKK
jgi:hypothetical protein